MTQHRVLLDAAAFLDSPQSRVAGAARADVREVAQRFLAACYDDLGKVPRLIDGDDMAHLLRELLPRHFGKKDPLAALAPAVIGAYLAHLEETALVPSAFEARLALDAEAAAFAAVVASGAAHQGGVASTGTRTSLHRGTKVGRNDPCPCGSGKKFKKCCERLGE